MSVDCNRPDCISCHMFSLFRCCNFERNRRLGQTASFVHENSHLYALHHIRLLSTRPSHSLSIHPSLLLQHQWVSLYFLRVYGWHPQVKVSVFDHDHSKYYVMVVLLVPMCEHGNWRCHSCRRRCSEYFWFGLLPLRIWWIAGNLPPTICLCFQDWCKLHE